MSKGMKMSPYMSDKLRVLSFLSILMVIYIHMYYTEGEHMQGLRIIEEVVGQGICRIAVPLFFVISGYLFFINCPEGVRSIWPKIRKRVRTLLVPYLLMNTFALLFYIFMNLLADHVPAIGGVLNFRILDSFRDAGILTSLTDYYWDNPVAFQLWFIRDLMVVVLFSPLIYLFVRLCVSHRHLWLLIPAAAVGLVVLSWTSGYFASAMWFMAGAALAMHPEVDMTRTNGSPLVAGVSVVVTVGIVVCNIFYPSGYFIWLIPVSGIMSMWFAYDWIFRTFRLTYSGSLGFLCTYTFFVYLVHEPLLNIFKKLPLLASRSELMLVTVYLLLPPLFYWLASLAGAWLRKILPGPYKVFTGGR